MQCQILVSIVGVDGGEAKDEDAGETGWWTEDTLKNDTEVWVRRKKSSEDPGKGRVESKDPHFLGSGGEAGRLKQREE